MPDATRLTSLSAALVRGQYVVALGGQHDGGVGTGDEDPLPVQNPDSGGEGRGQTADGDQDPGKGGRRETIDAVLTLQRRRRRQILHQSSMDGRPEGPLGSPVTF